MKIVTKIYILMIIIFSFLTDGLKAFESEIYLSPSNKQAEVLSGAILVKLKNTSNHVKLSIPENIGLKQSSYIGNLGIYKINFSQQNSVSEMIRIVSKGDNIQYAEPIYIRKASVLPVEYVDQMELKNTQWALAKIKAPEGWEIETGNNILIAVLDTGVDLDHPDLKSNIWINTDPYSTINTYQGNNLEKYTIKYDTHGWDFVNSDNHPDDDSSGHGTHCAGIIAASANNLPNSITGISWNNKIMAVKVLDSNGTGTSLNAALGIYYAADRSAKIINMSFGGAESRIEKEALDYAYEKGCVLVAAAGNNGSTSISYPAAHENVIAVGASDINDCRAEFSNYGNGLDLVAPGINIYSTIPGGYGTLSGTSMACPHVSGLASLVISFWTNGSNPNWAPLQVKNVITSNCDDTPYDTGWNSLTGFGRINVLKTLESIEAMIVNIDASKTIVYPNPFNPDHQVSMVVLPVNDSASTKKMTIYSLDGQKVRETDASGNKAVWDGKNDDGEICASGLYFYYLDTTNGSKKGKITLIR